MAREFVDRIECERPDRRAGQPRLAQRRLRALRGDVRAARTRRCTSDGVSIVAEDSSEPDLDHGQIGRNRYDAHRGAVRAARPTCASSSCTTTCCRCRARAASATSSTTPATCSRCCCARGVNLVLAGHKHVPYAWRLEDLFVVTTGTVSTLRLRGHTRPCYNVIEIDPEWVRICASTRSTARSRSSSSRATTHEYEKAGLRFHAVERARRHGAASMRVIALDRRRAPPGVVRDALDRLAAEHEIAAVLFAAARRRCRRAVLDDPRATTAARSTMLGPTPRRAAGAGREGAAEAVIDLSGDPVLDAEDAACAGGRSRSTAGLEYRAPGMALDAAARASASRPARPVVAVIGTGKRSGQDGGRRPPRRAAARARGASRSSSRWGGAARPSRSWCGRGRARPTWRALLEIARGGGHAASDYLEDAVADRRADGRLPALRRRAGGRGVRLERARGRAPGAARSTRRDRARGQRRRAAAGRSAPHGLRDRARTDAAQALACLGPLRLLRSQLVVLLGRAGARRGRARAISLSWRLARREAVIACRLEPEPATPVPPARASPSSRPRGRRRAEPRCGRARASRASRWRSPREPRPPRRARARPRRRAVRERCDVFLTELKAAAIDVVAERARGARASAIAFLRNRARAARRASPTSTRRCWRALREPSAAAA